MSHDTIFGNIVNIKNYIDHRAECEIVIFPAERIPNMLYDKRLRP